MSVKPLFEEFLYMDPETGMTVCMIVDGDGFRPATAAEELSSGSLTHLRSLSEELTPQPLFDESAAIDELIAQYEHSYGSPPPAMA